MKNWYVQFSFINEVPCETLEEAQKIKAERVEMGYKDVKIFAVEAKEI